jgi:hypothetical protein
MKRYAIMQKTERSVIAMTLLDFIKMSCLVFNCIYLKMQSKYLQAMLVFATDPHYVEKWQGSVPRQARFISSIYPCLKVHSGSLVGGGGGGGALGQTRLVSLHAGSGRAKSIFVSAYSHK